MVGGETFCTPLIRSHSLSELMSLRGNLHENFSGFFFSLGWDRMARVGWI